LRDASSALALWDSPRGDRRSRDLRFASWHNLA
jgi:hypothetical protein